MKILAAALVAAFALSAPALAAPKIAFNKADTQLAYCSVLIFRVADDLYQHGAIDHATAENALASAARTGHRVKAKYGLTDRQWQQALDQLWQQTGYDSLELYGQHTAGQFRLCSYAVSVFGR